MAVDGKSKLGKLWQSKTPVILQQVWSALHIPLFSFEEGKKTERTKNWAEMQKSKQISFRLWRKERNFSDIWRRVLYQNVWPILAEGMASSILIFENTSTCVCTRVYTHIIHIPPSCGPNINLQTQYKNIKFLVNHTICLANSVAEDQNIHWLRFHLFILSFSSSFLTSFPPYIGLHWPPPSPRNNPSVHIVRQEFGSLDNLP